MSTMKKKQNARAKMKMILRMTDQRWNDDEELSITKKQKNARLMMKVVDQGSRDDDEDDNVLVDYNPTESLGLDAGRSARPPSRSRSKAANLGEGVSTEARRLSSLEADLQKREDTPTLTVASQTRDGTMAEISTLMIEAEAARNEVTSALGQLQKAEAELRSQRSMVQRLMLTQEEMAFKQDVLLKSCWLTRYWGLCVRYGIYAEIAKAKHEYWSSFTPLPVEVVAARKKAKAGKHSVTDDSDRMEEDRDTGEFSGDGSAESMLIVEKGLRELAVLKVEDAVRLAMAHERQKTALKPAFTDDLRSPSQKFAEAINLSQEEAEDVQFKMTWLIFFWKQAKHHGVEKDIAEERLRFWISHSARASATTSHDAVDVERGLMELRMLGLETQLWKETRRWTDPDVQTETKANKAN